VAFESWVEEEFFLVCENERHETDRTKQSPNR
jgi:hypothetical protein